LQERESVSQLSGLTAWSCQDKGKRYNRPHYFVNNSPKLSLDIWHQPNSSRPSTLHLITNGICLKSPICHAQNTEGSTMQCVPFHDGQAPLKPLRTRAENMRKLSYSYTCNLICKM